MGRRRWLDHLGAAGLSLYLAGTPAAHAYVLDDADVREARSTERSFAGLVPGLRRACPKLEHVIGIDGDAPGVTALGELTPAPGFDLEDAAAAVLPDDRLTLMYTSGTTGAPKGVVYTHRTLLAAFAGFDSAVPATDWLHAVAFIPFAHAGQRAMGHYRSLLHGSTTTFCLEPTELPAVIADAWLSAPSPRQRSGKRLRPVRTPRWRTTRPPGRRTPARSIACAEGGQGRPADELAAVRARVGLDRLDQPFVSAAQSAPELLQGSACARRAGHERVRADRAAAEHDHPPAPGRHRHRGAARSRASRCGLALTGRCWSAITPAAPVTTGGLRRPRRCSTPRAGRTPATSASSTPKDG